MDLKDRQRKDQGTCWMMGCKDGGGGGYRVGVGAGPRSLVWGSAVLFSPCLACGPWVCVCACGTLKGHCHNVSPSAASAPMHQSLLILRRNWDLLRLFFSPRGTWLLMATDVLPLAG